MNAVTNPIIKGTPYLSRESKIYRDLGPHKTFYYIDKHNRILLLRERHFRRRRTLKRTQKSRVCPYPSQVLRVLHSTTYSMSSHMYLWHLQVFFRSAHLQFLILYYHFNISCIKLRYNSRTVYSVADSESYHRVKSTFSSRISP